METIIENHNQSICRVVEQPPTAKPSHTYGTANIVEEETGDYKDQRIKDFAVRLCLLVTSKAVI